MPTRRSVLKGTATAMLAAAAAELLPQAAFAKAPFVTTQAPGFYRLKVGDLEVTALSDGTLKLPLADLYTNTTVEHAREALDAAFEGTPTDTSVNAFLINTADRLILVDAGTGAYLGGALGRLKANIEASGYSLDDIDDVILTHVHTDHSGGLVIDGNRSFANATLHASKRDADFWLDPAERAKATGIIKDQFAEAEACLTPYMAAGKFQTFADDAAPIAGVGSILRAGHTPGHSSLVFESKGETIVFWGDITHGDVLQFDEPQVAIDFDIDPEKAVLARAAAFKDAAEKRYLVAGAHIAFPGIGHVRTDASNYDWVPLNYSATL